MIAVKAKQRSSGAGRFAALDGWRGICALLVVCLHAPVSGFIHESAFFRHGFLFVDFFFVLSGFVIAHAFHDSLAEKRNFGGFLLQRVFRVYPLHIAMLALFVAYEVAMLQLRGPDAAFQGGDSVSALVHNVLMTHSLGVLDSLGWNYPSWSISAELLAYTAFAAVVVFAPTFLIPLAAMTIAIGLVAIAFFDGTMDTTVHLGWLRCLAGFSVGVLIRRIAWEETTEPGHERSSGLWSVAECATVVMVAVFVTLLGGTVLSVAAPFVFGFAVYVFAHEGGGISQVLKSRPIAFLGAISYSVYMTHAFVISRTENVATILGPHIPWSVFSEAADGKRLLGANEGQALLAIGLIMAGTIVFSALTYRFVERPGIALGRRLAKSGNRTTTNGAPLQKQAAA
ncbi:acyltransferase family protein [Jiella marina]|uniref:acyltransferase family protein n=1 Tax=Jiella sp. LLJ827 TaxID=2917712 RepID=UPI002101AA5F|nr:acyltransferase [Jiella sp. LLJ827]MCQ0990306.1 acyltransferase [Jiella sp. LLJ827]